MKTKAAQITVRQDDQQFEQRITRFYTNLYAKGGDFPLTLADRVSKVMTLVRSYPEDLFRLIHDFFPAEDTFEAAELLAAINLERPQGSLREYIMYRHLITDESGFPLLEPFSFLGASMRRYPQLPYREDYTAVDEDEKKQITALLLVITRMHDFILQNPGEKRLPIIYRDEWHYRDDKSITIKGADLVQLIIDRPSDAEVIASIIIDRKTGDAEVVKEVLDSKAPSLMMGAL